ncbi:MAG: hypothetical protein CBB97_00840, partial [Candidatus Endolissoclinum sp. TMED37]
MKKNSIIGVIIQARVNSKRLPKKVTYKVNNKTILDYVISQTRKIINIDKIVVATTNNKRDDIINKICIKNNVSCFRGSESNVLSRYYEAASRYKFDHIIRVTADCPLIDPTILDKLIFKYLNAKVDFAHTGPSFAEGLDAEIFSYKTLTKCYEYSNLNSEKEHVTLYIHNNRKKFKILTLRRNRFEGNFRFTLDTKEDLIVIKKIINYFKNSENFNSKDIINYLRTNKK